MSILKKITTNTLIASLARIIDTILAFFLIALLTRHLGRSGYGHYTTIVAYIHIFLSLANLGLYNILLRDIGKKNIDEKSLVSNAFTIRLVGLSIFLPLAILVSFLFPYSTTLRLGISIALIATVFLSLYQVLVPIFQKRFKIIYVSIAELFNRLTYLGLAALFLLKFNTGLIPIIWAMTIAALVNFVLVFFFARKFVRVNLSFNKNRWKKILKDALPVGASIIFTLIYFRIDTVMLSLMKPASDVGIYGLSYKILESLIFFPAMFIGFFVPVLSRYISSDKKQFKKVFQVAFDSIILAIVPLIVGILMIALPVVVFLGGNDFSASSGVLKILSGAVGLIFLGSLFGQVVIILKKQVISMWIYLGGAIFNVLANLYFIPRYSYIGAAITTSATELIITICLIVLVLKNLRHFPSLRILPKAILATVPMAIFLYYFKNLHVLILVLASVFIYGILIYLFGGISKKQLKFLFSKS
jgi:O-antigen/teichoic acid export membrane protein